MKIQISLTNIGSLNRNINKLQRNADSINDSIYNTIKDINNIIGKPSVRLNNAVESLNQTRHVSIVKQSNIESFDKQVNDFIEEAKSKDKSVARKIKMSNLGFNIFNPGNINNGENNFWKTVWENVTKAFSNWLPALKELGKNILNFCKEHWKTVVGTVVLAAVVIAIAVFAPGATAVIAGLLKGIVISILSSAIINVLMDLLQGKRGKELFDSLLEGMEDGYFYGVIFGALANLRKFFVGKNILKHIKYRTPVGGKRGRWLGEKGKSGWISSNPKVTAITGGEPIIYKNFKPQIEKYSVFDKIIKGLDGTHKHDQKFIKGILEKSDDFINFVKQQPSMKEFIEKGLSNKELVQKFLEKYAIHHDVNPKNLNLIRIIPKELHKEITHTGNAKVIREVVKEMKNIKLFDNWTWAPGGLISIIKNISLGH